MFLRNVVELKRFLIPLSDLPGSAVAMIVLLARHVSGPRKYCADPRGTLCTATPRSGTGPSVPDLSLQLHDGDVFGHSPGAGSDAMRHVVLVALSTLETSGVRAENSQQGTPVGSGPACRCGLESSWRWWATLYGHHGSLRPDGALRLVSPSRTWTILQP